jgi:hypothetical protein
MDGYNNYKIRHGPKTKFTVPSPTSLAWPKANFKRSCIEPDNQANNLCLIMDQLGKYFSIEKSFCKLTPQQLKILSILTPS